MSLPIDNFLRTLRSPFIIFKSTKMKSSSFLPAGLLGMVVFCMFSCGGESDQKDRDSTDSIAGDTTTNTASTSTTPSSTIVTSPQHMMVVQHKVADFDKW